MGPRAFLILLLRPMWRQYSSGPLPSGMGGFRSGSLSGSRTPSRHSDSEFRDNDQALDNDQSTEGYVGRQLRSFLSACRLMPAAQSLPSPSNSNSPSDLTILNKLPPYGRDFRLPQPRENLAFLSARQVRADGSSATAADSFAAIRTSPRSLPPAAVSGSHRTGTARRTEQQALLSGAAESRGLQPQVLA